MFSTGNSKFEKYTQTKEKDVVLIRDPDHYIEWENGADIQVEYKIPDSTWDDWKEKRVLTGRDFDIEGLVVLKHDCAIVGEGFVPSIFAIDPSTGKVKSGFVR